MFKPFTLCAIACGLLAACASVNPPSGPETSPSGQDTGRRGELGLWARVGSLPPQSITPDGCGLFLWANMPKRTLVFFKDSLSTGARIMFDGTPLELPLESARGEAMLGHFFIQTYETARLKVTVSYTAEAREGLRGGAVVREGTWRLQEKGGWELILPVAGLIGCN